MSKSTLSSSIADLRKSYERAELSEDASLADPLQQFDQWLHEAVNAQVNEPNAMTVATVSSANTSPGHSGVPRFTRLHIFSARCQPCTLAGRCSANSKSGRQISEP